MQNNQSLQLLNADADKINDSLYINELLGFSKEERAEKATKKARKKARKKEQDDTIGKLNLEDARKNIKKILKDDKKSPWTEEIINNTLNESTFIKEIFNNTDLIISLKKAIIENDKKKIASIVSANALKTSFLNKDITTLLGKKSGNSKSTKATQGKINRELGVEASFKNKNLNFLLEEDDDGDDDNKTDIFHEFIDKYLKADIEDFYTLLKDVLTIKNDDVIITYVKMCDTILKDKLTATKKSKEEKLRYIRKICLNDRDTIEDDPFIAHIKDLDNFIKIKEENIIYYYLTILSDDNKIYSLLPYIFIKNLNKDKKDSVLSYENVKVYNRRVTLVEKAFNDNIKEGFEIYKKVMKDVQDIKDKEKEDNEDASLANFSEEQEMELYKWLSLIAHSRIQQKFYCVVENNIRNFKDQMKLEMQNDPKKKEKKETSIIKKAAVGYLTISYGVPLAMAAMGPLGWVAGPAVLAIFGSGTSMLVNNITGDNLSKLAKKTSPEASIIGQQIYKKVRSEGMYENNFNRKGQLITEAASGDDVLKKIRNVLKTKNLLHFKFELNKNFSKFDSLFLSNMGAIINEYFGLETSKKEKDDQNVEGSEKSEFNAANKLIRVCAAQAKDFTKNADGKFTINLDDSCDKAKFAKLINEIPVESRVPFFFKFIEFATAPEATDATWRSVFSKLNLRSNSSIMNVCDITGSPDKADSSEEESS